MMRRAHLTACVTLLLTAGMAVAQPRAGEWVNYRDAYRAMVLFDKYGGPKNLLNNQLQVLPRDKGVLEPGVQLLMKGKTVQTSLALDPLGRAVLPLLKAAYEENAVLTPNRPLGGFTVKPRVSLALRADGSYEVADLRAACEQALGFARYADNSARGRQCVGVRLVFPKNGEAAGVRVRTGGAEQALAPSRGAAFAGDAADDFPIVTYRFGAQPAGQVVTYNVPLAIVPLFE
ncbi:hypothetical protein [Massilia sp. CFBP9026]|uniref:hypothetical protein n=1 Tax=Massilia sp. CFBP9026 TaxID=3096536 RepID=UPI002A6A69FA|nr:hypothetical protein [Massilia sp. CFBP9026]MDY0965017.1 hypothetical protein [Massilia sp. CFBP9026]